MPSRCLDLGQVETSTTHWLNYDLRLNRNLGTVVSDGLGIGYMIKNEKIPITVSSFQRQALPFSKTLEAALLQMRDVLDASTSSTST